MYATHTATPDTNVLEEVVGRFAYINNLGYLYVVAALDGSLYGVLFSGGTADSAKWHTATLEEFGGWSYSLGDLSEFARALPEFFRSSPAATSPEVDEEAVRRAREEAARETETRLRQEFAQWKEFATETAHDYADTNDLCGEFDRCMEEIGLRPRSRSHTVRVRLEISVPVMVEATSEDAALETITSESEALEAVGDALGVSLPSSVSWYVSDWDVEVDG